MLGFSSQMVVRLFNELFGTHFNPIYIIIGLFCLLFILVSMHSYWFFRKLLIRAVFFIMVGFGLLIISITIPLNELIAGLLPDMSTYQWVYETAVIFSSVGSGFSLLFYSVWLMSHLKGELPDDMKPIILRRAKVDAGMGMIILFFLCCLYFSIGYVFLYEHGMGAPESDLTLEIVFIIMNLGPYGNLIFAGVCMIALFCSLLGGLYGRARVLEITLPRTISGFHMNKQRYFLIVFFLVLSAISSDFFFTQKLAREFIAIRLILFSVLSILLILIDRSLEPSNRGSPVWYLIMGAGMIFSFIIGINLLERYPPILLF